MLRACPSATGRYTDPRHEPHRWSDFPPDYDLTAGVYRQGKPSRRQQLERATRGWWLCPGSKPAPPTAVRQMPTWHDIDAPKCGICGQPFDPEAACGFQGRGRRQKYCSDRCREKAEKRSRQKYDRRRRTNKHTPVTVVECAAGDCPVMFMQRRPDHRYCSTRCSNRTRAREYYAAKTRRQGSQP